MSVLAASWAGSDFDLSIIGDILPTLAAKGARHLNKPKNPCAYNKNGLVFGHEKVGEMSLM